MLETYANPIDYIMQTLAFQCADAIRIEYDLGRVRFVAYLRDVRIPTLLNIEDIFECDTYSIDKPVTIEYLED